MNSQKKQKYILLSKIAKEKKYAQEYLSLLARRGDLGSIRIGKRWYTTEQWMNEFIEETARRKEEIASPAEILQPEIINAPIKELIEKVEMPLEVDISPVKTVIEEIQDYQSQELLDIDAPEAVKFEAREKVALPIVAKSAPREEKILKPVAPVQICAKIQYEKLPGLNVSRKLVRGEIIDLRKMVSSGEKNIPVRKLQRSESVRKMTQAFSAPVARENKETFSPGNQYYNNEVRLEYKAKKDLQFFSPDFSLQEAADAVWQSLFSKLAISFVTLLLLLVLSGGLIFQKDLREISGNEAGQVAGASDSRAGSSPNVKYFSSSDIVGDKVSGIPLVKSAVHGYIDGTNDRIRENISLSRVILESAVRKEQSQ